MRLPDTSVGQRLALGFGVVLLLLLATIGVYVRGQQRAAEVTARLTDEIMPRADAANDVEMAYLAQSAAARSYVYAGDERYLVEYRAAVDQAREAIGRLDRLPKLPEGVALYTEIQPLATRYTQTADRAIALHQQGSASEAAQVVERELVPLRGELLDKTEAFVALQSRQVDSAKAEVESVRAEAVRDSVALALAALGLGALVALLAARSVSQPARALVQASRALADGHFDSALALAARVGGPTKDSGRDEMRQLATAFGATARALSERDRRLLARSRLTTALAASIDPEQLARDALREVAEYVGVALGLIYAYQPETELLRPVGSYSLDATAPIRIGEGIPGQAAASRQRVVVRDIPGDTAFQVSFGFDRVPPRSVVATPLACQDQLVGVLLLASLHDLSDDDLDFVEVSARQVAVSLQNALAHRQVQTLAEALQEKTELLAAQNEELQAQSEEIRSQNDELQAQNEELQAQTEELQAQSEELANQNRAIALQAERISRLQAITSRLSESLEPRQVFDQVVRAASDLLGSDLASVLLLDEARTAFTIAAAAGLDDAQAASLRLRPDESLAGQVVAEGRALFVEDVSQAPNVRFPLLAGRQGLGAIVVAPLLADGEALGVVEVYFRSRRSFSADEVGLLSALAAAAAVAVRNARQYAQLAALDRQKDDFLSQASHELKSPLTSLKGFTQLLQRQSPAAAGPETQMKALATIDRQVDKVVRLVDRLLDVSRVQMGRLELTPERVDLTELVCQQVQQTQVRTDKHRLIADVDGQVVGEWDRGRVEQVLTNLLDNAVRYSPAGGEIRVSVRRENGAARLAVSDQGIGIASEALPRLFGRYYRSEEARQVSADGMGIGLYLVREIAAAHGGQVWVESEPGKGSTFVVELPLVCGGRGRVV